jgi:phosphoglycolate phosphatase
MQKIDLFIFDLDGTLIDSKRDIADSVHHTMKTLGLPPISDEMIYQFVGNGVTPLIQKSIKAAGDVSFEKALKIFKAHYDRHLLNTTQPFPGIMDVLDHFSQKTMVVVTNKPQGYSEKILRGLGMNRFFKGIFGGDTPFPKKPEPDVIHHILEKFGSDAKKTVIVGDSRIDLETGHNAGIITCGVTYGFRPRRELEEIGCDFLIERPGDLVQLFE